MSSSLSTAAVPQARSILAGAAEGAVIATTEALSFWGGVDPATGKVIDVHHPLHGVCLTGGVLFMPTSRGSCTGSGVLLDLILTGRAPSALVFCEAEDVLTLGALIAAEMFGKPLPVLRLDTENFARFSRAAHVRIGEKTIEADGVSLAIAPPATAHLDLKGDDRAMLEGRDGIAAQQAMRIIIAMAAQHDDHVLPRLHHGHGVVHRGVRDVKAARGQAGALCIGVRRVLNLQRQAAPASTRVTCVPPVASSPE